jgi:hypothetical protein
VTSFVFARVLPDLCRAAIDFGTARVGVMLVGAGWAPDPVRDRVRADVREEVRGEGYAAGGMSVAVEIQDDAEAARLRLVFGAAVWPRATIKARRAVYYRIGAGPADDALLATVDFGRDVASSNDSFTMPASDLTLALLG